MTQDILNLCAVLIAAALYAELLRRTGAARSKITIAMVAIAAIFGIGVILQNAAFESPGLHLASLASLMAAPLLYLLTLKHKIFNVFYFTMSTFFIVLAFILGSVLICK